MRQILQNNCVCTQGLDLNQDQEIGLFKVDDNRISLSQRTM